jgi:voltage-gated potassium channel
MPARLRSFLVVPPLVRRIVFHARRIGGSVDRHFFFALASGLIGFVLVASVIITMLEKPFTVGAYGQSFYWAVTTVLGQGDSNYVTTPGGWIVSWLLVLFGVAIVGTITGAIVGFVIDFLLKEGQGMGAAGFRDHIVICGWNTTAREMVKELRTDEYDAKVVLLHEAERNPAGEGVYFVRGDTTAEHDLRRAGIAEASAALVVPADASNEADMRSILTTMAIESIEPRVRTVVEVNNPAHVEHLRRAHADEVLVTSRLASRLLARSALYPGLSELMTDIVSGGEGSELYRVALPESYCGLSVDELSVRLRTDHRATLLAISRDGSAHVNPAADFRLEPGDDAVVVAESLGTLAPLRIQHD